MTKYKTKIYTLICLIASIITIGSSGYSSAITEKLQIALVSFISTIKKPINIELYWILLMIAASSLLLLVLFIYFHTKRVKESQHLKQFIKEMKSKPIDNSMCGVYFGIRKMAPEDTKSTEKLYYAQYLVITQPSKDEFQFVMFGKWDGGEFYIKGSCVRMDKHIILYGATNKTRDTFQVALLSYPVVSTNVSQLKGLLSLTRVDIAGSVATRIIFKKIRSTQNTTKIPEKILDELFSDDLVALHAKDYTSNNLVNNTDIKELIGIEDFEKLHNYINESPTNEGIIHS